MTGHPKQLQTMEVDGIPAFVVETGKTLRATLSFRAGMADETLATRGWTHLAEHLAMHGYHRPTATSNASVGALVTDFTVAGEPHEVIEFFALLCRWFREPHLEHLGHERGILLAESARRPHGEFANHISHRFGAQGYGLLAYDELGLHEVSEDQLRSLVARSFVSGNAALALNGPPPPGLRLDLPSGPRVPVSASEHLDPRSPQHCGSWNWLAASSGLCRGSMESTIGVDLLTRAIRTKLRDELGESYATTGVVERVDATTLMVMVESDVTEEGELGVVDSMHREYSRLGGVGPSAEEVDIVRVHRLRALADDLTGEWQAMATAWAHLRGDPPVLERNLRAFLESMTPESLKPTMAELAGSMLVSSPAGLESHTELPFVDGTPDYPAPVDGQVFHAALAPLDPTELVVSGDILEMADWSGNLRRTSMRDCVALVKYEDGGRVVWSARGDAFRLEPSLWRKGMQAVSVVDQAIDPSVHVHLPGRPRDALPQVPRFTLRQRFAVSRENRLGNAVFTSSSFVILGVVVALLFGRSNMPGGGLGGLVLVALVYAVMMTSLHRGPRKDRSRTRQARTAPEATHDPTPETAHGTTAATRVARDSMLISRSCTTGWLDWIHGELWITPDALVRLRLGLGQTLRNGTGPTIRLPERADPNSPQLAPEVARSGHGRNRYIEFDDISAASLRCGILNGRLTVTTHAGKRYTFLWLRDDPAFAVLRTTLPQLIPGRLRIE